MPDDKISTLKIVIEGDSKSAVKEVEGLVEALEKIDSTAKGVNNRGLGALKKQLDSISSALSSFKDASTGKLSELAENIAKINNAGQIKITPTSIGKIKSIGDAVRSLKDVDFAKLQEAASGLGALGAVGNIGKMPTAQKPASSQPAPNAEQLSGTVAVEPQRVTTPLPNPLQNAPDASNWKSALQTAQNAVREFDQQLKNVQSQINASNSAYNILGTGARSLAAQQYYLNQQISLQSGKVGELRNALNAASQGFGSTSAEARSLATQLNNASTKLNGMMKPAASEAKNVARSIKQVGDAASGSSKKSSSLWASITSGAKKAGSSIKSVLSKPFKGIGDSAKQSSGKLGQLFGTIKRIAMYRLIRSAIKAVTDALKEGIQNAYAYSAAMGGAFSKSMDALATSAQYLKNSLGAMAMPLINALAPAIDFIVDKFVDLLNVINMVIARLTGASTWTKAVKQPVKWGDATAGAAKGANAAMKELKATILGIDEINPLNDNSSGNGGGGGAGGGGANASTMFEEVDLGDAENIFGKLLDPFKEAWETKGADVIKSMKDAFGNIKTLVSDIGTSFANVWTNGTGTTMIEHILQIFTNINNIVGGLAKKIDEAWKANGNGEKIIQHILDMWNDLLGAIDKVTGATAEWVGTLDLTPLMTSFEGLLGSIEGVFGTLIDAGSSFYQNVILPIAGWFLQSGLPAILDSVSSGLTAVDAALKPITSGVESLFTACEPIFQWLGDTVVEIFDELSLAFQDVADLFEEKGPEIENIFRNLGDVIQQVWTVVEPVFTFFKNLVMNVFSVFKNVVVGVIGFVIDYLDGFLTFLKGVFTGDFEMVWEGIKKMWSGFGEFLKKTMASIKEGFQKSWATIKESAQKSWENLKKKGEEIWTNMKTSLTNIWTKTKDKATETWTTLKTNLSNIWTRTKENATTVWTDLKTGVQSIVDKIPENIKEPFRKLKDGVIDIFTKLKTKVVEVWEKLKTALATPINGILSGIEKMANGVIRGINRVITALNGLSFDVPSWVPLLGGKHFGFNIGYLSEIYLPRMAQGGIVDSGTAFIAGEAGAEVVANLGTRTGVMNTDQMRDAVELGVLSANASQNALLAQGVELLQQLAVLARENGNNGITGADILSAFGRMNRRAGRTLVSI